MRREKSSRGFDRVDAPPRTFSKNRTQEQASLRPQSSMRRSPSSGAAVNERQDRPERSDKSENLRTLRRPPPKPVQSLSDEELVRKMKTILEELYANKDEDRSRQGDEGPARSLRMPPSNRP